MARSFHFIAIGGAVMHQLAIYLLQQGNKVSGSDDVIFDPALSQLKSHGILPESFGWYPEKVHGGLDCIILGMHAKQDNPELLRAQELGLNIYSFPEFIYRQSSNKKRIAIAGSHGKTTITAMIMHILRDVELDFDYMVGSRIEGFETMVRISDDAEVIILEADEYLSSAIDLRSKFLHYHPLIAVKRGIAWDHVNVFPTFEGYLQTFRKFISLIQPGGHLFFFEADQYLPEMVHSGKADAIGYSGFETEENIGQTNILHESIKYPVQIFGNHNMENLKAAVLVTEQLGISFARSLQAMRTFSGSAKRLELIHSNEAASTYIFRDFAHAPSKLRASVNALRQKYAEHHITGVFELHTYSSLQPDFLEGYAECMAGADKRIVFLDEHALKIKQRDDIPDEVIKQCFVDDVTVVRKAEDLKKILDSGPFSSSVIALMSSGNFGGLNINELQESIYVNK